LGISSAQFSSLVQNKAHMTTQASGVMLEEQQKLKGLMDNHAGERNCF
jgi:hypothetical protein